jgi:hypothetical protein
VAAPIPLEAPVTIARLPSRAAIAVSLVGAARRRASHRPRAGVNGGLKLIPPGGV